MRDQVIEAAAFGQQVEERLVDGDGRRAGGGVHHRRVGADNHALGHLADFQLRVEARGLAENDGHVSLFDGPEAAGDNVNGISAGRYLLNLEIALRVAADDNWSRYRHTADSNFCIRYGSARRIGHDADDRTGSFLRVCENAQKCEKSDAGCEQPCTTPEAHARLIHCILPNECVGCVPAGAGTSCETTRSMDGTVRRGDG